MGMTGVGHTHVDCLQDCRLTGKRGERRHRSEGHRCGPQALHFIPAREDCLLCPSATHPSHQTTLVNMYKDHKNREDLTSVWRTHHPLASESSHTTGGNAAGYHSNIDSLSPGTLTKLEKLLLSFRCRLPSALSPKEADASVASLRECLVGSWNLQLPEPQKLDAEPCEEPKVDEMGDANTPDQPSAVVATA